MITKTGARWMTKILSQTAKDRLSAAGLIKSKEVYSRGNNIGADNMFKRVGYAASDINQMTPADRHRVVSSIQNALDNAIRHGDTPMIRRNQIALKQLEISSGKNPLIELGGHNPNERGWIASGATPLTKTVHVNNALPIGSGNASGKNLVDSIVRKHEAFEAVEAEKLLRKYYNNITAGRQRSLDAVRQNVRDIKKSLPPGYKLNSADRAVIRGIYKQHYFGAVPGTADQLRGTQALIDMSHTQLANKNKGVLTRESMPGVPVSTHMHMNVLNKERKMLDRLPHKNDPAVGEFLKMRRPEYDYMDAAGKYDSTTSKEIFGKVNARNVLKNGSKPVNVNGEIWQQAR